MLQLTGDTVHADGAYASFGAAEDAASQNVIANIGAVLGAAPAAGAPVFHTRIVVHPIAGLGEKNAPKFWLR